MLYVTHDGTRLEIGRIHRSHIDNFIARNPAPEPPTRKVEVWGGVEEAVPVWDDPEYQAELQRHYLRLGREQLELIRPAITVLDTVALEEVEELQEAGIVEASGIGRLLYGALAYDADLTAVVEEVFYQSTVTRRGIDEATAAYGATWFDEPVVAWKVPELPAEYSQIYQDRQAARFNGYLWEHFCELPGGRQSEAVAFFLIQNRLDWLIGKYQEEKAKARGRRK